MALKVCARGPHAPDVRGGTFDGSKAPYCYGPDRRNIHDALNRVASGSTQQAVEEPKAPAVPIKKSVQPDYIVCLDDGKRFKSLKRHLRTVYNLTPDQYRAKWGLRPDYPMVAPNYAATRSELAKRLGLGQQRQRSEPVQAEPQPAAPSTKGRRRKKAA